MTKNRLASLLLVAFMVFFVFAGCNKTKLPDVPEGDTSGKITPEPTPTEALVIPDDKISFIFLDSKKNSLMSIYHLRAFQELSGKGYNTSAMYVSDNQDLTGVFTQLDLEGVKYVFVTDSSLKDYIQQYKSTTENNMIFALSDNYWPIDAGVSYAVKLYEYYYFAGVALGTKSETSVAGFFAEEADSQTIRCINAFALGMKSVDENATVLINWAQNTVDEAALAESVNSLIYQNCDVFAYKLEGNLLETICENVGVFYMSPYMESLIQENEKLVITPSINLSTYVESLVAQPHEDASLTSQFQYLGVENGVITFNVSKMILSDETINHLYSITQSITSTSYEVFTGPIYNEYGMVVQEGVPLPETDIIAMLWFVDNVIGDIPAG